PPHGRLSIFSRKRGRLARVDVTADAPGLFPTHTATGEAGSNVDDAEAVTPEALQAALGAQRFQIVPGEQGLDFRSPTQGTGSASSLRGPLATAIGVDGTDQVDAIESWADVDERWDKATDYLDTVGQLLTDPVENALGAVRDAIGTWDEGVKAVQQIAAWGTD